MTNVRTISLLLAVALVVCGAEASACVGTGSASCTAGGDESVLLQGNIHLHDANQAAPSMLSSMFSRLTGSAAAEADEDASAAAEAEATPASTQIADVVAKMKATSTEADAVMAECGRERDIAIGLKMEAVRAAKEALAKATSAKAKAVKATKESEAQQVELFNRKTKAEQAKEIAKDDARLAKRAQDKLKRKVKKAQDEKTEAEKQIALSKKYQKDWAAMSDTAKKDFEKAARLDYASLDADNAQKKAVAIVLAATKRRQDAEAIEKIAVSAQKEAVASTPTR